MKRLCLISTKNCFFRYIERAFLLQTFDDVNRFSRPSFTVKMLKRLKKKTRRNCTATPSYEKCIKPSKVSTPLKNNLEH